MFRKFKNLSDIQQVERIILEEGYLLLNFCRSMCTTFPDLWNTMKPKSAGYVKQSRFLTFSEFLEAERVQKQLQWKEKVFDEFDEQLKSIEIMWGTRGIFRFQFVLPVECKYLTEESKKSIIYDIDYADEDRVKFFMQKTNSIHDAVSLKKTLQSSLYLSFLLKFQDELDYAIAALSVFINFVLVISLEKGYFTGHDAPQYQPESYKIAIQVFVILQAVLVLYKLLQVCVLTVPLLVKGY
jgi:hypothetical protein